MADSRKRLAVFTSGGDAPGMNAAIRSAVRTGIERGLEIIGIRRGYTGLLNEEFQTLGPRDVSNIIHRGGTILKTSRCDEIREEPGLKKAAGILKRQGIAGLVVIGGDGTFRCAMELANFWNGQLIGVPGTIDNDLWGTDFTIGYDTALETALGAIDKIRDTAESHDRIFLVEVMGRHSGFIALDVAISAGAEEILVPEDKINLREVCDRLRKGRERGKTSSIVVIAEGAEDGSAHDVAEQMQKISDIPVRSVILGHIQRGGTPTAADRLLATRLGARAVDAFLDGASLTMTGEQAGKFVLTPLKDACNKKKPLDDYLRKIHTALSQ